MFLASTAKSLLNATLLVCVFLFAMQSAKARSLCTTIDNHKTATVEDCKGNGVIPSKKEETTGIGFAAGGTCLPATSSGATSTALMHCLLYNFERSTKFTGGGYCPTGSSTVSSTSEVCVCNKGKNWSTANQKCK